MRMRYPALHNAQLDVENDTHDLIPGRQYARGQHSDGTQ